MFSEEAVKAITYLLGELRIMSAAKMTDWQCDYIIFFVNQIELGHNRASIRRKAKNILEQIKTDWTEEEEKRLLEFQKIIGNKWTTLNTILGKKSVDDVRNRYRSISSKIKKSENHNTQKTTQNASTIIGTTQFTTEFKDIDPELTKVLFADIAKEAFPPLFDAF